MNRLLPFAFAAGALLLAAQGAQAQVSVSVGQPGFYGRIDIGGAPPPVLVNPQPILVAPPPPPRPGYVVAAPPPPLYLRVPPGHQRNWAHHCGYYNACGQPVYFVQDRWYHDVYAPRYREMHRPPHHVHRPPPPPPHHHHHDRHDHDHDHDRRR